MQYKAYVQNNLAFELYFNFDNFRKIFKEFKFNIPNKEKIYNIFKQKFYGKLRDGDLIYKYGTLCRNVFGDKRTIWQKFIDSMEVYFKPKPKKVEYRKGFNFFDWDSGQTFTNMDDIHRHEKASNKTLVPWRDKEIEKSKGDREVKLNMQRKISKKLHHIFSEVQRGRSYTRELAEHKKDFKRSFINGDI